MAEYLVVKLKDDPKMREHYVMDCIRGIKGVEDVDFMPMLDRLIERLRGVADELEELGDGIVVEKQEDGR